MASGYVEERHPRATPDGRRGAGTDLASCGMRTIAVAVLGLFCGFLAATLVIELVARLLVDGRPTPGMIVFFAAAPQVGALLGVAGAIAVDRLVRRRAERDAR